jgi:2-amino-4-hydroxy-6-hydroxymethyldihydropteridine diphosphokinase
VTAAVLSVGSNLGDRIGHLRAVVAGLGPALRAASRVYQTPAWGDPDQPDYLNAALLVTAQDDDPGHWLRVAARLEAGQGRVRDPARRYGPRTVDVDVITVTAADGTPVTSDDPDLTLPHPRAHLRAFVLVPWLELEPAAHLPGHGPVAALLSYEPVVSDVAALRVRTDLTLVVPGGQPWTMGFPPAGPGNLAGRRGSGGV